MSVFVLIPTYNEKENIIPLLKKVYAIVPTINAIIIDANSNDGTVEDLKKYCKKNSKVSILHQKKKMALPMLM